MSKSTTDKPMRVCFVSLWAYPLFNHSVQKNFGGAEVEFYYLATELARDKNYQVSFIVADHGQPDAEVRQNVTLIKTADITKHPYLGSYTLWQALRRADAHVYVRMMCSLIAPLIALFCLRHHRKFVYRTASTSECDNTYIKKHPFRGRAFIWALGKADGVVAQNHSSAQSLLKTTGAASQVIRNAHPVPTQGKTQRDIILWVGRSADLKRPLLFVQLAKEHPHQKFVMICQKDITDTCYDQLTAQAKLLNNFELISHVPFHQTHQYFQRARLFVNTSIYEGFPNTFTQAAIAATPILSLSVNPDAFLDKHHCGLCADNNQSRFNEMFNTLLDPQTAQRLGNNAHQYALNTNDITKIIKIYKNIFQQITS